MFFIEMGLVSLLSISIFFVFHCGYVLFPHAVLSKYIILYTWVLHFWCLLCLLVSHLTGCLINFGTGLLCFGQTISSFVARMRAFTSLWLCTFPSPSAYFLFFPWTFFLFLFFCLRLAPCLPCMILNILRSIVFVTSLNAFGLLWWSFTWFQYKYISFIDKL